MKRMVTIVFGTVSLVGCLALSGCGGSDPACGDGALDTGEVCDDGNTVSGDGCSATCLSDETCGNGISDPGEECDDGNTTDGDGCTAACLLEVCGDGVLHTGEVCDDGNTTDGDGCSADCLSDETCGNGVIDAVTGEECDDGNTTGGDGCSAGCVVEVCGNGILDPGEECDDGNTIDGDGCDAVCQLEFVAFIDPVANGHAVVFTSGTDDDSSDITLPFDFPYWESNTVTNTTTTIGFGTNGGLRLTGGYTSCCSQPPLWTYNGAPTIHAHGEDGYTGSMYQFTDANMAVFTWMSMDYCCVNPGSWGVQIVLYPNGDWTLYQITATTDTALEVTIGFSDGLAMDNSAINASNLDWDMLTIGADYSMGYVDFGSSEPGGIATDRFMSFQFDGILGYTATVLQ